MGHKNKRSLFQQVVEALEAKAYYGHSKHNELRQQRAGAHVYFMRFVHLRRISFLFWGNTAQFLPYILLAEYSAISSQNARKYNRQYSLRFLNNLTKILAAHYIRRNYAVLP